MSCGILWCSILVFTFSLQGADELSGEPEERTVVRPSYAQQFCNNLVQRAQKQPLPLYHHQQLVNEWYKASVIAHDLNTPLAF